MKFRDQLSICRIHLLNSITFIGFVPMATPFNTTMDDSVLKQAVFDQTAAGIAVTDLDGAIQLSNKRFLEIVNIKTVEGLCITDALNHTISSNEIESIRVSLLSKQKPFHIMEIQVPFYETHLTWCIIKASLLIIDKETRITFVVDDITGSRQTIPRMATHLMPIIDNLPILIAHVDPNNRFVFANKTYEEFFHSSLDRVIGSTIEEIIGKEAFSRSKPHVDLVREGKPQSYDNTIFFTNQLRVLHLTLLPGETNIGDFYIYGQDVTELRSLQRSLEFKAYHDSLTGLPNRSFFLKSLNSVLRPELKPSALLFIDLDGLKETNDSFGHEIGDKLIQYFAQSFSKVIRPQDIVSRLGGDEFTIILTELEKPYENTQEICQRIFHTLPENVDIDGIEVPCSCSIGAIILDSQLGIDEESWISKADKAMYKAKKRGNGGYVIEGSEAPYT